MQCSTNRAGWATTSSSARSAGTSFARSAWDPIRRAFTAQLTPSHHLRERVAVDSDNQLDFYELRHFGASYMVNELELEPWVIAEQLRHDDGGRLVLELYGHPSREKAIERIRRA